MEQNQDFRAYCQTLTDTQCLNVLAIEQESNNPERMGDYIAVLAECQFRNLI